MASYVFNPQYMRPEWLLGNWANIMTDNVLALPGHLQICYSTCKMRMLLFYLSVNLNDVSLSKYDINATISLFSLKISRTCQVNFTNQYSGCHSTRLLTHGLVMPYWGTELGNKQLFEAMLTIHRWGIVTFTWWQFHMKWVWKSHFLNHCPISWGPMC